MPRREPSSAARTRARAVHRGVFTADIHLNLYLTDFEVFHVYVNVLKRSRCDTLATAQVQRS